MFNLNLGQITGSGANGSLLGIYSRYTTFIDTPLIGAGQWSDMTFNTQGLLTPNAFRSAEQTVINNMITQLNSKYSSDDNEYLDNETKNKLLDTFVNLIVNAKTCITTSYYSDINSNIALLPTYSISALIETIPLSSDRFVSCYADTSSRATAVVGQIIGDTIVWGIESISPVLLTNNPDRNSACLIDTDKILVAQISSGTIELAVGSITGSTISWGALVTFARVPVGTNSDMIKLCQIDTDKVLMVTGNTSTSNIELRVVTIAALVPTVNALVTIAGGTNNNISRLIQNGTDNAVAMCYSQNAGQYVKFLPVTVAGTVPTPGAFVNMANASTSNNGVSYTNLLLIDSNKFIACYDDALAADSNRFVIGTVAANVITVGNEYATGSLGITNSYPAILEYEADKIMVMVGNTYPNLIKSLTLDVSGSDPVLELSSYTVWFGTQSINPLYSTLRFVGSNILWQAAYSQYIYSAIGLAGTTYEFYNDAALILTESNMIPFRQTVSYLNSPVSNLKFFFAIKNISGFTNSLKINEVMCEVN